MTIFIYAMFSFTAVSVYQSKVNSLLSFWTLMDLFRTNYNLYKRIRKYISGRKERKGKCLLKRCSYTFVALLILRSSLRIEGYVSIVSGVVCYIFPYIYDDPKGRNLKASSRTIAVVNWFRSFEKWCDKGTSHSIKSLLHWLIEHIGGV